MMTKSWTKEIVLNCCLWPSRSQTKARVEYTTVRVLIAPSRVQSHKPVCQNPILYHYY